MRKLSSNGKKYDSLTQSYLSHCAFSSQRVCQILKIIMLRDRLILTADDFYIKHYVLYVN